MFEDAPLRPLRRPHLHNLHDFFLLCPNARACSARGRRHPALTFKITLNNAVNILIHHTKHFRWVGLPSPSLLHHVRWVVLSESNDTICRPTFPLGTISTASSIGTLDTSMVVLLLVSALCHADTTSARASRLPAVVHSSHALPPDLPWSMISPLAVPNTPRELEETFLLGEKFSSESTVMLRGVASAWDSGIVTDLRSAAVSSRNQPPGARLLGLSVLCLSAASAGSSSRYIAPVTTSRACRHPSERTHLKDITKCEKSCFAWACSSSRDRGGDMSEEAANGFDFRQC